MTWQLVIGIALIAVGLIFMGLSTDERRQAFFKCLGCWVCTIIGIILIMTYIEFQPIIVSKPLILKIEVMARTINNVEISRDTTYIYTKPK
jgi:hypothetical protein